jgi:transcriptional regulator with XRE-family HTH domain
MPEVDITATPTSVVQPNIPGKHGMDPGTCTLPGMAAARGRTQPRDDTGDTGAKFQKNNPTRLSKERPAPDTTVKDLRPPPEEGSIKKALRALRQNLNLTQQQLADMTLERPAEWGHRYRQADIQKFETVGRNGRPVSIDVACAFEDVLGKPRGTLLRMAGYVDDMSMWAGPPADPDNFDAWVAAARRLFYGDPYFNEAQAENLVQLYSFTRQQAAGAMPSGEAKQRRNPRRAENT